jgi:hypothetical protein
MPYKLIVMLSGARIAAVEHDSAYIAVAKFPRKKAPISDLILADMVQR